MEISKIFDKYEIGFKFVCSEVKKQLKNVNKYIHVRHEMSKEEKEFQYIIEIIKPDTQNKDDYGIAVDFTIKLSDQNVNIQIDVSKSYGFIYFSKFFNLRVENENVDSNDFDKSITWMKVLPDLILKEYLRDYK